MRKRLSLVLGMIGTVIAAALRRIFAGPKHPQWSFRTELFLEGARYYMRRHAEHVRGGGSVKAGSAAVPIPRAVARKVAHAFGELAGLPAEIHTPRDWDPSQPTLLYLHGGGYVACSPGTHRELIARIALATGARCYAPEYRLAPEHPFPGAIDDAVACYRALLAAGVRPEQLFVSGDSAGGGLSLALMQRLREAGEALPRAAVLLSPWVDLEAGGATFHSNAGFDYLLHELVDGAAVQYANGHDRRHPLISPIHADLAGFPPLLVQSGSAELFFAENELFVERARAAGVPVVHEIEHGMVHVFQLFAGFLPECRPALRSIGGFVREHAGQTEPREAGAQLPLSVGA